MNHSLWMRNRKCLNRNKFSNKNSTAFSCFPRLSQARIIFKSYKCFVKSTITEIHHENTCYWRPGKHCAIWWPRQRLIGRFSVRHCASSCVQEVMKEKSGEGEHTGDNTWRRTIVTNGKNWNPRCTELT